MRRKDREMGIEFALGVIDQAVFGNLSMVDEKNEPYVIPLSIVRDRESLYFHSAMDGKKVKLLEKNPRVSIAFVGEAKIPELYTDEELSEMSKNSSKAGLLVSKVFTTEYESAIVKGQVKLLEMEAEKIVAMKLLCEKYTPTKMDYFHLAINGAIKVTNIYKIEIEEVTAKRKKFASNGEEIKWGN